MEHDDVIGDRQFVDLVEADMGAAKRAASTISRGSAKAVIETDE